MTEMVEKCPLSQYGKHTNYTKNARKAKLKKNKNQKTMKQNQKTIAVIAGNIAVVE